MAEKFLNLSGLNTLWSKIKKLLPYWSTQKYLDIDCSSLTVENFLNKSDGLFSLIPWTTDVNSTSSGVGRVQNLSSEVANDFSIANFTMIRWWQARDFWEIEIVAKALNRRHRICYQSAYSTVGVMYFLHNANSIISGTFPIERGGTGATTANAAEYNLHQKLRSESNLAAEFTDGSKIPCILSTELINTTNGVFAGYRKALQIWTYIQSKISSVLGLTKDAYGGKAASATSADSATKATQDGSGNNIVNTYATKEALGSVNQSIAGLTSGVNSKLEKDGSNAGSTTTYNVLNAAAGGAAIDITDDEEIILTYPTGLIAYKRTLAKFAEWIETKVMPIINRKLNAWLGNEQEVVFNNVKVRQGFNSSEVEVATYYGISQSYYNKEYINETFGNIDSNVTRYNGTSTVDYSYVGLPIVCKPTVYSSAKSQTVDNWIRQCVPSGLITHGRMFILVNPSSVTYTITELSNGSYSLAAGNTLTIVYHNGTYYKASDKT